LHPLSAARAADEGAAPRASSYEIPFATRLWIPKPIGIVEVRILSSRRIRMKKGGAGVAGMSARRCARLEGKPRAVLDRLRLYERHGDAEAERRMA